VGAYLLGLALEAQLAPGVLDVADELFLLGATEIAGSPASSAAATLVLMWRD